MSLQTGEETFTKTKRKIPNMKVKGKYSAFLAELIIGEDGFSQLPVSGRKREIGGYFIQACPH